MPIPAYQVSSEEYVVCRISFRARDGVRAMCSGDSSGCWWQDERRVVSIDWQGDVCCSGDGKMMMHRRHLIVIDAQPTGAEKSKVVPAANSPSPGSTSATPLKVTEAAKVCVHDDALILHLMIVENVTIVGRGEEGAADDGDDDVASSQCSRCYGAACSWRS